MSMYGKFYAATYTGSMVGSGAVVFAVWGYVVPHIRWTDNSVELNPKILATIIGEPVEKIQLAIDFLCAPDPNSRSQEEEGRRMIREGSFLYRVVNAAKYRNMKDEDARRDYMRSYMQKRRRGGKQASTSVSKMSTYVDVDVDLETASAGKTKEPVFPAPAVAEEAQGALLSSNSNDEETAPADDNSPGVAEFEVTDRAENWWLRENQVQLWETAFTIHVRQQIENAVTWWNANPDKRRRSDEMTPWLTNWMITAQNNKEPMRTKQ